MNSLETAEGSADFNVVLHSRVVNQKLPYLFTLKKPFNEQAKSFICLMKLLPEVGE